jgi:hypothetical protein
LVLRQEIVAETENSKSAGLICYGKTLAKNQQTVVGSGLLGFQVEGSGYGVSCNFKKMYAAENY